MRTFFLARNTFVAEGVFGVLSDEAGVRLCDTCEHSYGLRPKLQPGTYKCVRGMHQLHSGPPFNTFEVTGVAGHAGILFHKGNTEKDSEGCILVGDRYKDKYEILGSRSAFEDLQNEWNGINEFSLVVTDETKGA